MAPGKRLDIRISAKNSEAWAAFFPGRAGKPHLSCADLCEPPEGSSKDIECAEDSFQSLHVPLPSFWVDLHVQRHVGSLDVPHMVSLATLKFEGFVKKPHLQAFWQRLAAWVHLGGRSEAVVKIRSATRPSSEEGGWRRRQGWKRDQEIWEARTISLLSLLRCFLT